jgi:hypothetical protein
MTKNKAGILGDPRLGVWRRVPEIRLLPVPTGRFRLRTGAFVFASKPNHRRFDTIPTLALDTSKTVKKKLATHSSETMKKQANSRLAKLVN